MTAEFELRCPISPDLAYIRDLVRIHGKHNGLAGERLEDLVLAVNEAVTNVLDHGGRAGMVTARSHAHGITVEIVDIGGKLTTEHLTTATINPTASSGFGLWVVQHLCDDVTLQQSELGSVLSLHMHGQPAAVVRLDRRAMRSRTDAPTRALDHATVPSRPAILTGSTGPATTSSST